jgi:MFS family permease
MPKEVPGVRGIVASTGLTRRQWFIGTMGATGVLLDGYDLSVISFSALLISGVYHVPTSGLEYALLLSSALIGMAIGGVVFGRMADLLGRKTMFVVDLLMFVVFGALSAVATNIVEVIVFRALMGIGIGADYPISSSLIAELSPRRSRGMLLMYGMMFYWLGAFVSGIVNYLALPLGPELSWRVALGVGAIMAAPIIAARWLMPESARWLAAVGRVDDARQVAGEVWGTREVPEQRAAGMRDLLGRYRKPLIYVLLTWFAFDVGSYGLGFYTPTLYYELGIKSLPTIALFTAFTAPFPKYMIYCADAHRRQDGQEDPDGGRIRRHGGRARAAGATRQGHALPPLPPVHNVRRAGAVARRHTHIRLLRGAVPDQDQGDRAGTGDGGQQGRRADGDTGVPVR